MRILELEINEVRGLRHIILRPTGKNIVICGPNGSGKSGVVDAVDFLLTGRIQRLMGRGTRDLSLKKHGVHIGSKASDTEVRAVISVPGHSKPIEISRSIAQPEKLICSDQGIACLDRILDIASRGQHVLSRREILKFITSEAGDRAQEIQAILNLTDIEAVRKSLVRAHNDLKKAHEDSQRDLKNCEANLAIAAQIPKFDVTRVLEVINAQRATLGGPPIGDKITAQLKTGLTVPQWSQQKSLNLSLTTNDVRKLEDYFQEPELSKRAQNAAEFLAETQSLLLDSSRLKDADRLQLFQLGTALLDETGECPLCDTDWPDGSLAKHLHTKIARAKEVTETLAKSNELLASLRATFQAVKALLDRIQTVASRVGDLACAETVRQWQANILDVEQSLVSPFSNPYIGTMHWRALADLGRPEGAMQRIEDMFHSVQSSTAEAPPEQTAWDLLTRIQEHSKLYSQAVARAETARSAHARASLLYDAFESTRNRVLQGLYEAIKDRFVELYRDIHVSDEASFQAEIRPDGAGLAFEVDFYGTGNHPPHALHSEGHQDSMGLCLYLALAEYLNKGTIELIILDDVVMSVDAGHRREVCRVLSKHFANHQFLITTHERAWAGQLRTEGVVNSKNSVSFFNWTLANGPCVDEAGGDMWKTVQLDLERGNVQRAAATLRYGLESFFRHACGALRAPIPYNLSERWDFGEYLSASVPRLKRYLTEAAQVAESWEQHDDAERFRENASILGQVFTRSQAEQWAINPNVHYNNWANFTKQDFEPVVEAMEELCRQFVCSTCNTLLGAQGVGIDIRTVTCNCGKYSLNLQKKKAELPSKTAVSKPVK